MRLTSPAPVPLKIGCAVARSADLSVLADWYVEPSDGRGGGGERGGERGVAQPSSCFTTAADVCVPPRAGMH